MDKILIVDNAKPFRNLLKLFLNQIGYETIEAVNGIEAIEMYKKYLPDLVIMDLQMPVMDGIESTQKIINTFPDAKIIITSASEEKSIIYDVLNYGAKNFIIKPFKKNIVLKAVQETLNLSNTNNFNNKKIYTNESINENDFEDNIF